MQADVFSVDLGRLTVKVASESGVLRAAVEAAIGPVGDDADATIGLLVSQPAAGSSVGSPTWILYESGDIVLRRSRIIDDLQSAACFHLRSLQTLGADGLIGLRLRTIVQPDGTVLLVSPGPVHALAGHDRRLAAGGFTVTPSTVVNVDPVTFEVVLPDQQIDPAVPVGRLPIDRIVLTERVGAPTAELSSVLNLAHSVLRTPLIELQPVLRALVDVCLSNGGRIATMSSDAVAERIAELGRRVGEQ